MCYQQLIEQKFSQHSLAQLMCPLSCPHKLIPTPIPIPSQDPAQRTLANTCCLSNRTTTIWIWRTHRTPQDGGDRNTKMSNCLSNKGYL